VRVQAGLYPRYCRLQRIPLVTGASCKSCKQPGTIPQPNPRPGPTQVEPGDT